MDDPWYGETEAAFDQTYSEIKAAADGVVDFVRAELALRLGPTASCWTADRAAHRGWLTTLLRLWEDEAHGLAC